MFKNVKNAGKALKNLGIRSSSRHSSNPSEMSVDPTPPQAPQAPSSSSDQQVKVLLKIGVLGLKTRREKEVYQ